MEEVVFYFMDLHLRIMPTPDKKITVQQLTPPRAIDCEKCKSNKCTVQKVAHEKRSKYLIHHVDGSQNMFSLLDD